MKLGIIDYGAGNLRSLLFAFERLGVSAAVSNDPAALRKADRLVFPGVGAAGHAMRNLQRSGLDQLISAYERPLLGICLGMQLLCRHSEEDDVACLGIFQVDIRHFEAVLKVPHTGWNEVLARDSVLFKGLPQATSMYFVHSYAAGLCNETIAQTPYPGPFSSGLQRDNFYGVQFHPEKSGRAGERLLQNFLSL